MIRNLSADNNIPQDVLKRFRLYQPLLKLWKYKQQHTLSISLISEYLDIPRQTVSDDLSHCPGWNRSSDILLNEDLILDCIDMLLGEKEFKEAILIGAGKQGTSLLRNEAIAGSGLKIVAAFDIDPEKVGNVLWGIKIQSMEKLPIFVRQMHLKMAIIATTPENALKAVDQVVNAGLQVIWNFTQTEIPPREGVIVQNTATALDIDADYQKILSRL